MWQHSTIERIDACKLKTMKKSDNRCERNEEKGGQIIEIENPRWTKSHGTRTYNVPESL